MKLDLSSPAVRNVVEYFAPTFKMFRDQIASLKKQNLFLNGQLHQAKSLAIRVIMQQNNCSWEIASQLVDNHVNPKVCSSSVEQN